LKKIGIVRKEWWECARGGERSAGIKFIDTIGVNKK